jgi:uncharacterized protein (UPF0303 family)
MMGTDVSIAEDISKIIAQEKALRFKAFAEDEAWALGAQMHAAAEAAKLPMVIDIRIGARPLFYVALAGTTPENPDWVRRKVNTVMRFHKSSYLVGLEYKSRGAAFDASRGIDVKDHADAGGGFPIHIEGTGVVGSITVSGIPQREDHGFVVQQLCIYLKQDPGKLALGPEGK